jgi:hypothetical protein
MPGAFLVLLLQATADLCGHFGVKELWCDAVIVELFGTRGVSPSNYGAEEEGHRYGQAQPYQDDDGDGNDQPDDIHSTRVQGFFGKARNSRVGLWCLEAFVKLRPLTNIGWPSSSSGR